jgi:general secretion pathway protein B
VYAPEIPPAQGSGASIAEQRHPAAPRTAGGLTTHHASHLPDPVLSEAEDKSDDEVLPSISEINLTGPQALPELHLDVHVYATQPAERFVYINMRKYREGATLAEGPVLERIRRDGVVLSYNGLRFVLPRQQ